MPRDIETLVFIYKSILTLRGRSSAEHFPMLMIYLFDQSRLCDQQKLAIEAIFVKVDVDFKTNVEMADAEIRGYLINMLNNIAGEE